MLSVLLNWLYIFFVTAAVGLGFCQCLNRLIPRLQIGSGLTRDVVCGIVITTVYAQFFSLFHKVGLAANLFLLALCIGIALRCRKTVSAYLSLMKKELLSWDGILYAGVLLLIAFATSRGLFHTDTNIYHAQAIRWYEEMGVVKGLGNFQWHFAYNSAYFAFAALFSLGFLGLQSFHCTTGFLAALFCIWALRHLKDFSSHDRHMADMCCVGILLYALVNYDRFMSPASDYAVMFLALYLIARWAQEIESGRRDITAYSLLCVLAVFLCTLKLSAGPIVLLTAYPLFFLVKEKRGREIALYLSLGIVTALPFLIRNVIVSGWLLYPFPALDLFSVDWKMPAENVMTDAARIKVWARCLYDTAQIDTPLGEWLPIWWEQKERYEQMLLYCDILALCLDAVLLLHCLIKRKKPDGSLVLLNAVVILCAVTWFALAPFIRYGLAFLIAVPMLAVGMWLHKKENSLYRLLSGCIVFLMFFVGSSYWERYFTDDIVYLKHNVFSPYYVMQQDYDTAELETVDLDGVTVYTPVKEEVSGYDVFPVTTYLGMLDDVELRGADLRDGFRSRALTH